MFRNTVILFVVLACTPCSAAVGPLETLRARDLQIRRILNEQDAKQPAEDDARLQSMVCGIVDFEAHARESLGIYWDRLDEAQRREAVDLITLLLERSLLRKVMAHRWDEIKYVSESIDPADATTAMVLTLLKRDKDTMEVSYRMRKSGDQWKIVDILLQGAGSVERNRSTFYKEIKSSGVQGLLEKLRKKAGQTP